jgi:hypothetical protein
LLRNNKTAKTGFPISRLAAQIWKWRRCRSKAFFAAQKSAFFVFSLTRINSCRSKTKKAFHKVKGF